MNSLCAVKNPLFCIPLYTVDTSIYYVCSVVVTGTDFTGQNNIFCSHGVLVLQYQL